MGSAFVPPPVSSWEGPAKLSGDFTPPPPSSWEGPAKEQAHKAWLEEAQHAVGNWWDQVNPVTQSQGAWNLVRHPVDAIKAYGAANQHLADKAEDAFKKGNYGEGVRHSLGYLFNGLPGIGATLDEAGDQAGQGDISGALGKTAGLATNVIAGSKAPQIAGAVSSAPGKIAQGIRGSVKNINPPVVERALALVEHDVPMSVGQRSGNLTVQRVEQGLENVPGASGTAQDFYRSQQDAIARKGADITGSVSPVATNEYGAGRGINDRLTQRISRLKGQADNLYGQVRDAAAKNQQTVQVGTQQSPILGANGQPITSPVMQTLESPIDLNPVRAQLQPIYDDITRLMPEAKKASSPAYSALHNLMTSPEQAMNAMDFDQFLGAVKSISRDGTSPFLTNKSQSLARQIISAGEGQLQQALTQAGPTIPAKLTSARNIVKSYYDTSDVMEDVNNSNKEPGVLFDNLTRGGDRVTNTLKQLQKIAPHEIETVGRTFLQDLMNKATREGGFGRAPGIMAGWDALGPETKTILFGKQAPVIDNFMIAAKKLTANMNPSGTAKMAAALGSYGAAGSALLALLTGNPVIAGGIAAEMTGAHLAADLLFSPQAPAVAAKMGQIGQNVSRGLAGAAIVGAFPQHKLDEFAAQNGLTPDQARQRLQSEGWTVQ